MHGAFLRLPNVRAGHRGVALLLAALVLIAALAVARPAFSLWNVPSAAVQPARPAGWTPSYSQDVAPVLARACVRCHGPQQADKGLRLDSYQRIMAGDSYGTVVIPGGSSLSTIVSVVKYGTMPHDSSKLTPEEIDTISLWIDAGAPDN